MRPVVFSLHVSKGPEHIASWSQTCQILCKTKCKTAALKSVQGFDPWSLYQGPWQHGTLVTLCQKEATGHNLYCRLLPTQLSHNLLKEQFPTSLVMTSQPTASFPCFLILTPRTPIFILPSNYISKWEDFFLFQLVSFWMYCSTHFSQIVTTEHVAVSHILMHWRNE